MLSTFFSTQWNNPSRGDWSEQIKVDLNDFGIDCNFEEIKSKSKDSFKQLVKVRAREFAKMWLTEKKASHSKMDGVHYSELKMQSYLKSSCTLEQKRTIFRWRTRIERFGENYRGGGGPIICPLCETHLDNQPMSLHCPVIKEEIENSNIDDLLKSNVSQKTADTITEINKIRENKLGLR